MRRTDRPSSARSDAVQRGPDARPVRLSRADLGAAGAGAALPLRLDEGGRRSLEGVERFCEVAMSSPRDPAASGRSRERTDPFTLSERGSGEALLIRRRPSEDRLDRPFGPSWMLAVARRERRLFRDVTLAALTSGFLALAPPLVYMVVVDRVLVRQRASTLLVLLLAIVLVLAFDTALGSARRRLVAEAAAGIDARIGLHLFDRLIGLPMDFFERRPTGETVHELAEVQRVRTFLTGRLSSVVLETASLVVPVAAMFVPSAPLAPLVLGIGGLMALIVTLCLGPRPRAYTRLCEAERRRSAFPVETVAGARTIEARALEPVRRRERDALAAASIREATALRLLADQPQTSLEPLETPVFAGSLALGPRLAASGQASVLAGTLVAFTMIAGRATQPIVQLAGLLQQLQEVRGALAQVASVVDHPPERRRRVGVRPELRGAIRFERVRFRYPGSVRPTLDDASFAIEPGHEVGIKGRGGSGETTVTRSLQGLHEDHEALVRLDGVELREIELGHLRRSVGVVLQDSFLFQGTIRENILAGRPDATPEEVVEAARLAGAEEFIARLPRGFDSPVEEGSSNLSGGQRQRPAIARVLSMRPSILVLDDATRAPVPDGEALVEAGLRRIATGRTMLPISHRRASLVDCDQILVLDDGHLLDSGRHGELLGRCELSSRLWPTRNRHLQSAATVPFRVGGPREPVRVARAHAAGPGGGAADRRLREREPGDRRGAAAGERTDRRLAPRRALGGDDGDRRRGADRAGGRGPWPSGDREPGDRDRTARDRGASNARGLRGDLVVPGAVLATSNPTFPSAGAGELARRVATLTAEIARLEAEIAEREPKRDPTDPDAQIRRLGRRHRPAERRAAHDRWDERIRVSEASLARLESDIAHLRTRLELRSEIEQMHRHLEGDRTGRRLNRPVASDARVEAARNPAASRAASKAAPHELEALRPERRVRLDQWSARRAEALAERRVELERTRADLVEAERRRELVELRAPSAAVALEIARPAPGVRCAVPTSVAPRSSRPRRLSRWRSRSARPSSLAESPASRFVSSSTRSVTFATAPRAVWLGRVSGDAFIRHRDGRPAPSAICRAGIAIAWSELRDLSEGFRPTPVWLCAPRSRSARARCSSASSRVLWAPWAKGCASRERREAHLVRGRGRSRRADPARGAGGRMSRSSHRGRRPLADRRPSRSLARHHGSPAVRGRWRGRRLARRRGPAIPDRGRGPWSRSAPPAPDFAPSRRDGGCEPEAARLFELAAELDDTTAAFSCGAARATGRFGAVDRAPAARFRRRAAGSGSGLAAVDLARLTTAVAGVEPDHLAAERLLLEAAGRGEPHAPAALAELYALFWPEPDPARAAVWLERARAAGDRPAETVAARLARVGRDGASAPAPSAPQAGPATTPLEGARC